MRWIDGGTRVVTVDMNAYNPATDTLTSLRITTEFMVQGMVLKAGWAFSSKLTLYSWSVQHGEFILYTLPCEQKASLAKYGVPHAVRLTFAVSCTR